MKAFAHSQFRYCPLIWMFHVRNLNNKINRIHECALRIVYCVIRHQTVPSSCRKAMQSLYTKEM